MLLSMSDPIEQSDGSSKNSWGDTVETSPKSPSDNVDNGYSSWLSALFSPTRTQQKYNAAQAVLQREFESSEAEKARQFSALEAQKNRDFQERLSNTSFRRMVEDLSAAGFNPYLAYSSGGSSTPSGSMATSYSARGATASAGSGGELRNLMFVVQALAGAASAYARVAHPPVTNIYRTYNYGKQ